MFGFSAFIGIVASGIIGRFPVADLIFLYGVLTAVVEVAGILLALRAVLMARTPQSAIGWAISLVIMPVVAIPLFLVFGESRFSGYSRAGTGKSAGLDEALKATVRHLDGYHAEVRGLCADGSKVARNISGLPPTNGNRVRLLVDGQQTFEAIFDAIACAKEAVWVQFFIIHDDVLGRELAERLLAAAARGVECLVMYDQVGSKKLPASWCEKLVQGGVKIQPFVTNRQYGRHFQINFRNHRKLLVVDGSVAFVGGLNAGDEYMGRSKKFGPWRDTHLRIEGPSVAGFQITFLEDWNYATKAVPNYRLRSTPSGGGGRFPRGLRACGGLECLRGGLSFGHPGRQAPAVAGQPVFRPVEPAALCDLPRRAARGGCADHPPANGRPPAPVAVLVHLLPQA